MALYKEFANTKPVGIMPLSNWGGIEVLELRGDYQLVACFNWGTGRQMIRWHNIHRTASGRPYIWKAHTRYYLDRMVMV